MATIAELNVEIGAELSKLDQGLNRATSSVKDFSGDVDRANNNMSRGADNAGKSFSSMGNIVKGVGVAMAAAFSVDALLNIGSQIISTTANFQKMEAVLTNTLGSQSAAQNAMLMIQDIAAKTPFSVEQLSESFVKLANRGIKPTSGEIIKLGDLAASTGKDFDQLTEAMLDAMTGEFERLKDFGVRASAQGDKVAFTFKGVTTEVAKTDQAIKAYVLSLGDLEGVSGANAAISATLGGRISNLGDSFTTLFKTIGEGTDGPLGFLIEGLNSLVKKTREAIASNQELAKEYAANVNSGFAEGVSKDFAKLKSEAETAGWDVNEAMAVAFDAQKGPLQDAVAKFEAKIKSIQDKLAAPSINMNAGPMGAGGVDPMKAGLGKFLLELEKGYAVVKGKLEAVEEAYKEVGVSATGAAQMQIGTLAGLRKELDALQDAQLKVVGANQIQEVNAQIAAKEAEIKKYLELGDAQRKQQQTLAELNQELQLGKLYAAALGESYDYVGGRIGTLEGGIKELVAAGFKPGSAAVQNFRAELQMLKDFDMRGGAMELLPTYLDNVIASMSAAQAQMQAFKPQPVALGGQEGSDPLSDAELRAVDFATRMTETGQALGAALQGVATEGLVYLGETIGSLFTGNFQGVEAFFKGFLGIVADFMAQFGQQLIALGIGKLALDKLFESGIGAIAAGVALVALAGVVKSISSKGTSAIGGSSGGGYSAPTRRADTYSNGGAAALNIQGETRIVGSDLVVLYNRAQEQGRRTG